MKERLIEILRCPHDGGTLYLRDEKKDGNEIESGLLVCQDCGEEYPIRAYVPRFVDTDSYSESFSFEWRIHQETQMPDSQDHETAKSFNTRTGFSANGELQDRLVLDAGCGVGRYMSVASRYGAEVVGVDFSHSVDQAMKNVGHHPQCHIIQADLMNLPFGKHTFDYLFSLGVLHHIPNPHGGFRALAPLLRPGGHMAVSVYSSYSPFYLYTASRRLRRITTRMNKRLLYSLTTMMALLLYPLYRIPFLKIFYPLAPISMHPKFSWRRLDTFDCYSPKYQHTYTYHEVFQWFKEQGFVDVEVLEAPVSLRGSKPHSS